LASPTFSCLVPRPIEDALLSRLPEQMDGAELSRIDEAVCLARDLVDTPPGRTRRQRH